MAPEDFHAGGYGSAPARLLDFLARITKPKHLPVASVGRLPFRVCEPVVAMDLRELHKKVGVPFDGILGMEMP
jgi:hypothetical protein